GSSETETMGDDDNKAMTPRARSDLRERMRTMVAHLGARAIALLFVLAAVTGASAAQTPPVVYHALSVTLAPDRAHLAVRDEIVLPAGISRPLSFLLDSTFEARVE